MRGGRDAAAARGEHRHGANGAKLPFRTISDRGDRCCAGRCRSKPQESTRRSMSPPARRTECRETTPRAAGAVSAPFAATPASGAALQSPRNPQRKKPDAERPAFGSSACPGIGDRGGEEGVSRYRAGGELSCRTTWGCVCVHQAFVAFDVGRVSILVFLRIPWPRSPCNGGQGGAQRTEPRKTFGGAFRARVAKRNFYFCIPCSSKSIHCRRNSGRADSEPTVIKRPSNCSV